VVHRRFRPSDVLELPKLTQVLAASLVQDGWIESGLKDDLACLADQLDWFLKPDVWRHGTPWVHVKRDVLPAIVEYLWEDELKHFRECEPDGRTQHIFRRLVEANMALKGMNSLANCYVDAPQGLPAGKPS